MLTGLVFGLIVSSSLMSAFIIYVYFRVLKRVNEVDAEALSDALMKRLEEFEQENKQKKV